MPKNISSDAPFAAENVRFLKSRIGSIGAEVRSSQATNPTRSATPAASDPTISGLVQPCWFARTSPHTRPSAPAVTMATPGRSSRIDGPRLSRSRARPIGSTSRPSGTFSQKIHCHEIPCDHRAADQRAERDAEAADAAPRAQREPAPLAPVPPRSGASG